MNVSTDHMAVTQKRYVLTQREAIVVLVRQDSLALVECVQVSNDMSLCFRLNASFPSSRHSRLSGVKCFKHFTKSQLHRSST